jgi:anti-anti-sigma regulatory factor
LTDAIEQLVPEAVNFDNLAELRRHAETQIDALADGQSMLVRFASSSLSGSAAVALMIAMYRRAHVAGKRISFVDVPGEVVNIIEVSGLTDVLPIAAADETGTEPTQN